MECQVAERRKRRRFSASASAGHSGPRPQKRDRANTDLRSQNISHRAKEVEFRDSAIAIGDGGTLSNRRLVTTTTAGSTRESSALSSNNHDGEEQDDVGASSGLAANADRALDESELAKRHLIDFVNQDLQYNTIRARSTYVGNELSNLNFLTRQRATNRHVYHYPCSNVYVSRLPKNPHTPAMPNLIPKDAFMLPPPKISDALIDAYFTYIHPTFPIIDKETFLSQYRTSEPAPPMLLIQSICLVGSHVSTYKNSRDLKAAFFRRAKALLDGRYEEDRMHVVQAALLLTWFSDGGDDICANAWWCIGLATRTAIGLGSMLPCHRPEPLDESLTLTVLVHRDVTHSKMPERDKRTWRMIWWCLVQFDCLVSLTYGRPQAINLNDCDVRPLQTEDFDASTGSDESVFVIQHAKLCTIVSELVQSHFSVKTKHSGKTREDALETVDSALAEWMLDLPPNFRESAAQHAFEGPWPLLLHLTYNTVLIQFHRASVGSLADDPLTVQSSSDGKICTDAALTIVHIFEQLRQQSALQQCWFWAPSSLFTAMLQISGELKCSNRILALRTQEKHASALKSLEKLARHWLFAISVLRLFQSSNQSKPAHKVNGHQQQNLAASTVPPVAEDGPSNDETMVPMDGMSFSVASSAPQSADGAVLPLQEMAWVQAPAVSGEAYNQTNDHQHFEFNRWQNNLGAWESLYWTDPLSIVSLDDNFGNFNFDGLG